MLRVLLAFVFIGTLLFGSSAQSITIQEFTQQGNGDVYLKMVIEEKNSPRERYDIQLFSSFNGGNFQRLAIDRDNVPPGQPVIFTLKPSDLGGTGTQLQLKVEIEASTFPLVVRADSKVKTGKSLQASWTGYNVNGPYRVELIDDLDRAVTLAEENGTSMSRALDDDIDKGSYTLRVTPANNREAYGEAQIRVVGGSKVLLIAAPIVVGGGAAAYFLLGGDPEPDPPVEGLPGPPNTPTTSN